MESIEIQNLREHFKAIERGYSLDGEEMSGAIMDYAVFIGRSSYLSSLIKQIALDDEIKGETLFSLWLWSYLMQSLRGFRKDNRENILKSLPLLRDRDLDAKYNLRKKLFIFLNLEKRRVEAAKKMKIKIDDVVLELTEEERDVDRVTSSDEDLFSYQTLHNQILSRAFRGQKRSPVFDELSGILRINSFTVKFRKFTEQYHCLRVLFSEKTLHEEHFFSELAQRIDSSQTKYTDKNMHNYFTAIRNRIATETGIKDLLLTTNQSVSLNTDYLE